MNEVVLSSYPGSFRLTNEMKIWLLREREAFHLFSSLPIEESNFVKHQVLRLIHDEDKDFAGTYDGEWAFYNARIVNLKSPESFVGLEFDVKSGQSGRSDSELIEVVKKFDDEDLHMVEVEFDDLKIETGRNGEYILNQSRIDS